MKQSLSMRLFSIFLVQLSLALAMGSSVFGQTEAQAGEDILILEKQGSSRTTYLRAGDKISYPVQQGNSQVDHKGEIVSIEEDGVVLQTDKKGDQVKVNLDELPYWRRHRPGMLAFGWVFLVMGVLAKIFTLIGFVIALSSGGGFGALFAVIFLLALIIDPFSGSALVGGILLVSAGRKKISKPKWNWRLGRLLVKKSTSASK